jgi:hypothetical protein
VPVGSETRYNITIDPSNWMSNSLYATIDEEVGDLELISLQSVGDLDLISLQTCR